MAGQRRPGRHVQSPSRRLALASAVGLALVGCVASSPETTGTLAPIIVGPTPVAAHFEIGTIVWIDGFIVKVDSATATLDSKGGPVAVVMDIENIGADASLDAPITLVAGDVGFELAHGTELPDIPAGATQRVNLEFEVIGRATIDDGIIRIGRAGDHEAMIPLRPDPSQTVSLTPQSATLKVSGKPGILRVTLRRVEYRWDLPDWHDELPLASEALTVTYDVTNAGDFAGGTSFTADNVELRLPDRTFVSPRPDGHSQTIVLIHRNETIHGLQSRFEIPTGLSGAFALIVNDGSLARVAMPFTIGP